MKMIKIGLFAQTEKAVIRNSECKKVINKIITINHSKNT